MSADANTMAQPKMRVTLKLADFACFGVIVRQSKELNNCGAIYNFSHIVATGGVQLDGKMLTALVVAKYRALT
ncbi:hypothetical protein [Shewanella sp. SNU WT4]|uniref:hypothetical protein n=1 Tax=Shewanella sp. SNU WT4 TaxID=2590015 RepID=UPI00143D8430|nr:hypothetical protein [Shewanella sp. SNU WT4]